MKKTFSQRNGYTPVENILIRESMPQDVINEICTVFDQLKESLFEMVSNYGWVLSYIDVEKNVWTYVLHKRLADYDRYDEVIVSYLQNPNNLWYQKLDFLEACIALIQSLCNSYNHPKYKSVAEKVIHKLNKTFTRLNYGYRIVDDLVVEVMDDLEVKTIKKAVDHSEDNVRTHLHKSLELLSRRPDGDYANSVKESISAVEALCRKYTGKSTLGEALKYLEKAGVIIPPMLKSSFISMYAYTNSPETGIRHALMDPSGKYIPSSDEAIYMLVSCAAFINYLTKKKSQIMK